MSNRNRITINIRFKFSSCTQLNASTVLQTYNIHKDKIQQQIYSSNSTYCISGLITFIYVFINYYILFLQFFLQTKIFYSFTLLNASVHVHVQVLQKHFLIDRLTEQRTTNEGKAFIQIKLTMKLHSHIPTENHNGSSCYIKNHNQNNENEFRNI